MKENQLNSLQNAHWDFCLHKPSLVVFKWEKDPSLPFLSAERSSFASLKQKLKEGKPVTHTSVIFMCFKKKKNSVKEIVYSVVAYFRKIPLILLDASLPTLISLSPLLSLKLSRASPFITINLAFPELSCRAQCVPSISVNASNYSRRGLSK